MDKLCNEEFVESIVKSINGVLPTGVSAEIKNFGNCIEVSGAYDMYIWIRLTYNNDKYIVDFSSVFMGELIHKGYFTKIFDAVRSLDFVREIRVTSIITDMMWKWCKKNNFKCISECDSSFVKGEN